MADKQIADRLEYLRSQIESECISYSEIVELESLAEHIDPGDNLLLQWAGVPEGAEMKNSTIDKTAILNAVKFTGMAYVCNSQNVSIPREAVVKYLEQDNVSVVVSDSIKSYGIRNYYGTIVDVVDSINAENALTQFAISRDLSSSELRAIGYNVVLMPEALL